MIDDTPPLVHTSLLTHSHTATLFSTNWATLQTPLAVYLRSRSKQTTHSEKSASYTVPIKPCPQAPLHVSSTTWSCLLCRAHLPDTEVDIASHNIDTG